MGYPTEQDFEAARERREPPQYVPARHRRVIFHDIEEERVRQDAKFGDQSAHPDVDRLLMRRDGGCSAMRMAEEYEIPTATRARVQCQRAFAQKRGTWAHILVEEVAEAVEAATILTLSALRIELIQCAAVIVAWIEAIDRRTRGEVSV